MEDKVYFKWKDYRDAAKVKVMRLDTIEFLRRFALHILSYRYLRIRHYGILSITGEARKYLSYKNNKLIHHLKLNPPSNPASS